MITITHHSTASTEEWQAVWEKCSHACFSLSPEWTAIWSAYHKGKITPVCQQLDFSDGKTALLVVSEKQVLSGWLRIYESAVQHGYGGLLSQDNLTKEHYKTALAFARKKYKTFIFRHNPFSPYLFPLPVSAYKEDYTYAVDLERDEEELQAQLTHKKIATKARSAERKGLTLRLLNSDDLPQYLNIYKDAVARWKQKNKKITRYDNPIFEAFMASPNCDFQGVWYEDELICGGPMLRSKHHVVSWLALARTDALSLKPYEFLYYHLIFHYKKEGFSWFDFHPSGGHAGVDSFKERFATDILPAPVLQQFALPYKIALAIKPK